MRIRLASIMILLLMVLSSIHTFPVTARDTYILGVPWQLQKKDTNMLCLQGCPMMGPNAWDRPHADHRIHGDMYCVRASLSMIANWYNMRSGKPTLSEDRITYFMMTEANLPVDFDLKHSETSVSVMEWVFQCDSSQIIVTGKNLDAIISAIDNRRPILACWNGHARVIDGYDKQSGSTKVHILDPWTRSNGVSFMNWDDIPSNAFFQITPEHSYASQHVRSDEPEIWMDSDGDGLCDFDETVRFGTDPMKADTDNDGIPDKTEVAGYVFDEDGNYGPPEFLRSMKQELVSLYPDGPKDGQPYVLRYLSNSNPIFPYTDLDFRTGENIGWQINQALVGLVTLRADPDNDGLRNEVDPDSDGDGLLDGEEDLNADGFYQILLGETDPMNPDTQPPTTAMLVEPEYQDSDGVFHVTQDSEHALIATDEGPGKNGVYATFYRCYPSSTSVTPTFTEYSAPFKLTSSSGTYKIDYYSVDQAGNIEPIHTRLEKVSPLTDLQAANIYVEGFTYSFAPLKAPEENCSYTWKFNTVEVNSKNPQYKFTQQGIYQLSWTAKLGDKVLKTSTFQATVLDQGPKANFTHTLNPVEGSPCKFTDRSTTTSDAITSWQWNFGDGQTSIDKDPVHTYLDDGNYKVTLTVSDSDGSKSVTTQTLSVVNLNPTLNIDESFTGVAGEPMTLKCSVNDQGKLDSLNVIWDYGDGGPTQGYSESPEGDQSVSTHTFPQEGVYQVTVTVSDGDGGVVSKAVSVIVGSASKTGTLENGKISFTSERDGNLEIYTMNADGSNQTRLTNNKAGDEASSWSPNGTKIAFVSNRDGGDDRYEIYVMNADGTGQTKLTNNKALEWYPSWSPDGTKITYESNQAGNGEIYVMNVDGSGQTRLTNNKASDEQPRWSPDGTKITFNTDRDGNMEIYVMNADGSNQTRLTNNKADDQDPNWSNDGTKIAFVSDRDGDHEIYVMNADGSEQTQLTDNNAQDWDPNWSPDGSKIAFDSDRDGNYNIYTMNPDGSGQIRLTSGPAKNWDPFWQSLSKLDAALTLRSSTEDTLVDTDFILDGALSAPRSGTVTLYWSIGSSGFIYAHNETMTDGEISRSFGAGSAGTWSFKLVWAGDDEYNGAESNIVSVVVNPTPVLTVTADSSPSKIFSGGASAITVRLSSDGTGLTGATMNLASNNGGTFSPVVDNGDGSYTSTYSAPDATTQTSCVITASAQKAGYPAAQGVIEITVQPLTLSIHLRTVDDKPVSGASLVSTTQPGGQATLSGTADADGLVSFTGVLKGSYAFKVTKQGYADKTVTIEVKPGQATTETINMTTKPSGVPGYPYISIVIALATATIILYSRRHTRRDTFGDRGRRKFLLNSK